MSRAGSRRAPESPRWSAALPWLVACLVVCAATASGADAQGRRRLQSRAAFAALDSTSLVDSAALGPLLATAAPDSLLLRTATWLDTAIGRRAGLPPVRLRWWNGFGTQAHPSLGILVDRGEIDEVQRSFARAKGSAGVPTSVADARFDWALRFVVGHEYGHLLQYHALPRDSVEDPARTRALECSADLLGAAAYRRMREADARAPNASLALEVAQSLGQVVGSTDWLDATTHPVPEDRRRCIADGMTAAAWPAGAAAATRTAPGATVVARDTAGRSTSFHALVEWSLRRADSLVGARGADGAPTATAHSVVRDTAVEAGVARLAARATRGPQALLDVRGERAPGAPTSNAHALRESLPVPWRCVLTGGDSLPVARCRADERGSASEAEGLYGTTLRAVRNALGQADWQESATAAGCGDDVGAGETEVKRAVLVARRAARGGAPARVCVSMAREAPERLAVQTAPRTIVTIAFVPTR